MRTTIVTCFTIIALGLAFDVAAAEQTLKPIHAYRLGNEDQPAVLYYTEQGDGYRIVTTWVDEQEVQKRHIGHLESGQHYTLSLGGLSPPVQFTVRSNADHVIMNVPERPVYAHQCSVTADAYPTPLQRLVLYPRDRGGEDGPLSASIEPTSHGQ